MPLRSANRKTKAKKSTSQSKTPVVSEELDNKDQELAESKGDLARQEEEAVINNVEEREEANVIKQEIEAPNGIESLSCDGEDRVPVSSGVEVGIKVEVVEERSTEIVMEENVNVDSEDVVENEKVNDKYDDAKMDDLEEDKGDNVNGNTVVMEEEPVEGGVVSNGSSQPGTDTVAEPNSHEENIAADINVTEARGYNNNNLDLLVVEEGSNQKGEEEESGDDEESEEDREDNKDPIIEGTNENNFEIFVGGLDKKAVEDDLIEVFGKFGEIKAARIVRKSNTKKSKGFAFIQYATLEQTKNALSELTEGIEVKGKHVRVSTSRDKDALYIDNICKTWTKERVLEKLKEYGIEDIVDIQLPDDQNKTKGFVLLKFNNHTNAIEAHRRLSMPDAVFGCDRSAKVAFKHILAPNDEALSQVKRVYIEGLAGDWNEEKLKEICKQYGEISEVTLVQGLGKKRKDIGFVSFTSRESALACVEGIDNAQIGESKVKVKAAIAKPQKNGRPQQQIFSGGFVVEGKSGTNSKREGEKAKKTESSKGKGNSNSKWGKRKGKAVVVVEENKKRNNKPQRVTESQTGGDKSQVENRNRKRKNRTSKGEGHHSKGREEHDYSRRPPKRARDNTRGRQSSNFRNPKRDDRVRNFQVSKAAISESKRHSSDMEPHAGFLQPAGGKQVHPYSGYVEPGVGSQVQHHVGYREAPAGIQSQTYAGYHEPAAAYATQGRPHVIYREPTVWTQQGQTHSGYLEPAVVRHAQPHASGYPQPAVVRHDGQVSSGSAYVAGSALPPYVAKYTSHPGYEGHSSGGYYQSNGGGAYVPRRAYY